MTRRYTLIGRTATIEDQRDDLTPARTCRPESIVSTLHTHDAAGNETESTSPATLPSAPPTRSGPRISTCWSPADSAITLAELASLIHDAFFSASDSFEADSYDTQIDTFHETALDVALELLTSRTRRRSRRSGGPSPTPWPPLMPRDRRVTIEIEPGTPATVSLQ